MTARWLLDTSVYCQPLKPRPNVAVLKRWQGAGDESLTTSALCIGEIWFGIQLKQSKRLRAEYEEILHGKIEVLPFETEEALAFGHLKAEASRKGKLVSDFDLAIAATAITHHLIVATLNIKHFEKLPGVRAEDWATA